MKIQKKDPYFIIMIHKVTGENIIFAEIKAKSGWWANKFGGQLIAALLLIVFTDTRIIGLSKILVNVLSSFSPREKMFQS